MNDTDEIKEWHTHSAKLKVAAVLMMDGIPFNFNPERGIVFTAPDFYVERLKDRLVNAYGCSKKPIINKIR